MVGRLLGTHPWKRSQENLDKELDEEPEGRLEGLRGLCFCLLYDLCCWLARARQPVGADADGYSLSAIQGLVDPQERLRHYVSPTVLEAWANAARPFFEMGATLAPELGDTGPLWEEGLDDGRPVRAEVRFRNMSALIDRDGRRHRLPSREWVLRLWVAADLSRVESARLEAVEP